MGVFTPRREPLETLRAGEVGFIVVGAKNVRGVPVGDTLIAADAVDTPALPGFRRIQPRVYAGLFPADGENFEAFREALRRLSLNDASLHFEPEHSNALGPGFRCGFLGMLHMEIVQERLEREYDLNLIASSPTVSYEVALADGSVELVSSPSHLPDPSTIDEIREPIVRASLLTPRRYLGATLELCISRRGEQRDLRFVGDQCALEFALPMGEVVSDFFDRLKSLSRGYASLDYAFSHFQAAPMARLDILINGERVDALAVIVHRAEAQARGRALVERIRGLVPRQMFDVAIQAAIGGHILARETVKALRKNVTAKCYGGDVSRKRKLLEKQKKGKKRMKRLGRVEVPQEAFMAVLGDRN